MRQSSYKYRRLPPTEELTANAFEVLDLPQNAEPIFTDGKVVIYTVSKEAHSYEESFVCDVFYYNITDKKTIQIKKSFNGMITGNPAYIDDKLYGSLYLPITK